MKSRMLVILSLTLLTLSADLLYAQPLVELDKPYVGELKVVGFELKKEAEIKIEARGLYSGYGDNYLVYSWIIDNETRGPVWEWNERWSKRSSGRRRRLEVETTQTFPAGRYEIYLYAGDHNVTYNFKGIGDVFGVIFDNIGRDEDDDNHDSGFIDDAVEDCYVRLSSDELSSADIKTFEVTGDLPGALIKHNHLENSEYIETGFTLSKDGKLRIYSVLEFPKGDNSPVDGGWIVNADSREKVWEIDRWNTDYAGGGDKNRVHDQEVDFPAGNYILYFATDDSHSFEAFNVNPPYDPLNWGITILTGRGFDRSSFKNYELPTKGQPLIDFTKARNNEYFEQGFTLSEDAALYIYAIGEMGLSSHGFADYGSIIDVNTGREVWEMTRRNTDHAGGNEKNRLFDGAVELEKGSYIAVYVTDDSHAYRSFNASPPFDPKAYGMAIYPGKDFKPSTFKLVDVEDLGKEEGLLVNITRVGDHERIRKQFSLDKDGKVNIYALGEGDRSDMFDYAWIISEKTGRDVWEMTWRNTFHAGGATKNRVFDDEVYLEAGEYEVVYVTDGSHSFNDWNSERPDDPRNWGIKIRLAK